MSDDNAVEAVTTPRAEQVKSLLVYAVISIVAALILVALNVPFVQVADSSDYILYAETLLSGRYQLVMSLRTYGYPLFIMLCQFVGQLFSLSLPTSLIIGQFLLHLATARVAAWVAKQLLGEKPRWVSWLIFAAIAWNPYLLAAASQSLTESFSAACLTFTLAVILEYLLRPRLWLLLVIGALVGFCTLVRPYHLVWGVLFLGSCVLIYRASLWHRRYRLTPALKKLALLSAGFILVAGSQIVLNRLYPPPPDAPTPRSLMDELAFHVINGIFTYRYETAFNPAEQSVRAVYYYNATLYDDPAHPVKFLIPLIKVISLFQQHDVSVYRTSFGIVSPLMFGTGLVMWCFFCYALLKIVPEWWQSKGPHTHQPRHVLMLALVLYIALYATLTIPETRYIVPIYPVLSVLALVYAYEERRWSPLIVSVCLGIGLYLLTAYILLDSLNYATIMPHLIAS